MNTLIIFAIKPFQPSISTVPTSGEIDRQRADLEQRVTRH